MPSFSHIIHATSQGFQTLRDEWNALLPETSWEGVFLNTEILAAWWQIYHPGSLSIVEIKDEDDATIAILPLYWTDGKQDEIMLVGGEDAIDYLSPIIRPSCEEPVIEYITSSLLFSEKWQRVVFQNIPFTSSLLQAVKGDYHKGIKIEIEETDVCPRLALSATYEDTLMTLEKKQRHELRRKRRRAEESGAQFRIFKGEPDQLTRAIDEFLNLMAVSTPEKAAFIRNADNRDFFHRLGEILYERGMLELAFLDLHLAPAAGMWQIATPDTTLLYNSGFDPDISSELSTGNALFSMCLEDSISRGRKVYDFLRGGEEYKYRLGAKAVPLYRITFSRE